MSLFGLMSAGSRGRNGIPERPSCKYPASFSEFPDFRRATNLHCMHSAVYTLRRAMQRSPSVRHRLAFYRNLSSWFSVGLHYEGATDGQFQEHLCQFLSMPQYTLSELSVDFSTELFFYCGNLWTHCACSRLQPAFGCIRKTDSNRKWEYKSKFDSRFRWCNYWTEASVKGLFTAHERNWTELKFWTHAFHSARTDWATTRHILALLQRVVTQTRVISERVV